MRIYTWSEAWCKGSPASSDTHMVANVRGEASKTCAGFSFVSGSRIASWLPSFSVEVMHTTNILGITQASNSQLNAMVRSARCF